MLVIQLVSLTLVALACAGAHGRELKKDVPVLVKTLNNLHRGPPKQTVTRRVTVAEKWITQPLDHFDETNEKTFQMVSKKDVPNFVPNIYMYKLI